jgi:hypothetical protein
VLAWASARWGVRQLVERGVWELAANAEAARAAGVHASPVLFCAFCDGGFDADELQFFLYCRQTLLLLLGPGAAFLPSAALTRRQADAALRALFGPRAAGSVMHAALAHLCADFFARRASLEAFTFLKMLLAAYHDSRPQLQPDAPASSAASLPEAEHGRAWETPPAARNSYALNAPLPPPEAARAGTAAACSPADAGAALRQLLSGALPENVEAYADVLVAAIKAGGDSTPRGDARQAVVDRVTAVAEAALQAALQAAAEAVECGGGSDGDALAAAVGALLRAGQPPTVDDGDALCQRVLTSAAVRQLEPVLLHLLMG